MFTKRVREYDDDGMCLTHNWQKYCSPCMYCEREDWQDLMDERNLAVEMIRKIKIILLSNQLPEMKEAQIIEIVSKLPDEAT